jgi:hypothetical protein
MLRRAGREDWPGLKKVFGRTLPRLCACGRLSERMLGSASLLLESATLHCATVRADENIRLGYVTAEILALLDK